MHDKKNNTYTLLCFSPFVMLLTLVTEVLLVLYMLIRYKLKPGTRWITLSIILLAIFQLAEYAICGTTWGNQRLFATVGYLAITLLPPVGLHIAAQAVGKKPKWLMATDAMGVLAAAAVTQNIITPLCGKNYAIFVINPIFDGLYTIYYFSLILLGLVVFIRWMKYARKLDTQRHLLGLILGYLAFVVPAAIVTIIKPEAVLALPSIMCGFALVYALILATMIVPDIKEIAQIKKASKNKKQK